MEQYELTLDKAEVDTLLEHFDELSTNVRFGVRMCQVALETRPLGVIYPDIACMVEVVRVLGYIPRHVHVALADALRADVGIEASRLTRHQPDAAISENDKDKALPAARVMPIS